MVLYLSGYDSWKLDTPPHFDDVHHAECENGNHFLCHCGNFIFDGERTRNWCTDCGKFAPRPTECICEYLGW